MTLKPFDTDHWRKLEEKQDRRVAAQCTAQTITGQAFNEEGLGKLFVKYLELITGKEE